jgi:malic enzyme
MKLAAALALAGFVRDKDLSNKNIIPSVYDFEVFAHEAEAVGMQAVKDGVARIQLAEGEIFKKTMAILEENKKRFFSK